MTNTIICWNCGRHYDSNETVACPSCGEYPGDDPALIESTAVFNNADSEIEEIVEEDEDEEEKDEDYYGIDDELQVP